MPCMRSHHIRVPVMSASTMPPVQSSLPSLLRHEFVAVKALGQHTGASVGQQYAGLRLQLSYSAVFAHLIDGEDVPRIDTRIPLFRSEILSLGAYAKLLKGDMIEEDKGRLVQLHYSDRWGKGIELFLSQHSPETPY